VGLAVRDRRGEQLRKPCEARLGLLRQRSGLTRECGYDTPERTIDDDRDTDSPADAVLPRRVGRRAGELGPVVDTDGPGGKPLTLAQSGAIVIYLAEKAGRFIPADPVRRLIALQWLLQATTDAARASSAIFMVSAISSTS